MMKSIPTAQYNRKPASGNIPFFERATRFSGLKKELWQNDFGTTPQLDSKL